MNDDGLTASAGAQRLAARGRDSLDPHAPYAVMQYVSGAA